MECSASDLIAPYVGQTGPKTVAALHKGLGKVLFVDEAYRLGEGHFAKEAIDELVDSLTKPQFFGKLVVILAGYSDNMNRLLQVNPGLSSRFPEEIVFQNMAPEECLTLLERQIKAAGIDLVLDDCQSKSHRDIIDHFKKLSRLSSWGNGRDVKTLSKAIVGAIFAGADPALISLTVSNREIITALERMYAEQIARCEIDNSPTRYSFSSSNIPPVFDLPTKSFSPISTAISTGSAKSDAEPAPTAVDDSPKQELRLEKLAHENRADQRDAGVSDETWAQLQADIVANELAKRKAQNAVAELEQQAKAAAEEQKGCAREEIAAEEVANMRRASDGESDDEDNEQKRRHEDARIRALKARLAVREAEEKLRIARLEEEKKRKEEVQAQKKLRKMGVCPVGFRWIKQSTGYRCAGGAHYVSNAELEAQQS